MTTTRMIATVEMSFVTTPRPSRTPLPSPIATTARCPTPAPSPTVLAAAARCAAAAVAGSGGLVGRFGIRGKQLLTLPELGNERASQRRLAAKCQHVP